MGLPKDLYDALEVLARERGLINVRNGQGNRRKLIEEMIVVYQTRTVPNEVRVGALVYPVKWVERYSLLQPGCLAMHRIIGRLYPDLNAECQRQIKEKLG